MWKIMMRIRADRVATLYLFYPLLRVTRAGGVKVPILMYHSISENNNGDSSAYYQTTTSPGVFAEQMKFLSENGYTTIVMSTAVDTLKQNAGDPGKKVVVTFDDGFEDFLTRAFPVMQRYGFTATVFLPTAFIGDMPIKFKGTSCLTWSQVKELHAAGVLFGSHTVNHPQLASVGPGELERELCQSKKEIEDKLGSAVPSFAYPYAFPETNGPFKLRLSGLLEQAGYKNGVSTVIGTAAAQHDPLFLPRLPMNSWDDLRLFRAKLEGGYNWLHGPQYLAKVMKGKAGGKTASSLPERSSKRVGGGSCA
jgi:peptidoglycan/xylan/chitin deacetylase (PgdA/CDA1 family)